MRRLITLVLVLTVLGGLGVAADYVARRLAEDEVEHQLRNAQEITGDTQVHIRGFPFLTQLARKRFTRVDLDGAEVGNGEVQLTRFTAALRGVRVLSGGSSARVEAAKGTGFMSFADIQRESGHQEVAISQGDGGRLRLAGNVEILGQKARATVQSDISVVNGDELSVRAAELNVAGFELDSNVVRLVRDQYDFTLPVRGLPQGLHIVGIRVVGDGIAVDIEGQDVLLSG